MRAVEETSHEPQNLSLIEEIGTAPCIFKLEDSFYDFTPIRVAYPNPNATYFDGQFIPTSPPKYNFVFGWCQQLDDIDTQTLCKQPIYAGRLNYTQTPTPD